MVAGLPDAVRRTLGNITYTSGCQQFSVDLRKPCTGPAPKGTWFDHYGMGKGQGSLSAQQARGYPA